MFWSKKKEVVDEEYVKLKNQLKDETNKANQMFKKITELSKSAKALSVAMKRAATQFTTGLGGIAGESESGEVEKIIGSGDLIEQDFTGFDVVVKEKCLTPSKMRLDHLKNLKKMSAAADAGEVKYNKQVSTVASLEKKKKKDQEKLVQAIALKEHLEGKYRVEIDKCKDEIAKTVAESEEFYETVRHDYCAAMKDVFGRVSNNFMSYCEDIQGACMAVGKL